MDIPDTQSVLETFMSKLLKQTEDEYQSLSVLLDSLPDPSSSNNAKSMTAEAAREKGVIPEADEETLRAFSPSEMKLYRHATDHKWTVDELISTIKLIKSADFNVDDVNIDIHKRVAAAIAQGKFTSHNMRESDVDGDQDLTFLSFHAFCTEIQPQLFHTSTAADRGTLLSAAVPMVRALTRGGAAMFTRSTPGCGTLDDPSLAWAAYQCPKLRKSEGSPGLRLPNADGQLRRLAREFCMVYTRNIPVYTWYILSYSKT